MEAKLVQLSRELHSVRSRLAGMTNLEDRIEALEVKLGRDNQFDNPPIEHEIVGEPLHIPTIHHTLPNTNTTNNKPSSDFMQHSVRQQSVRCSNPPDPSVTDSQNVGYRILSPHTTHSNKEDSALHLVSTKSKDRELNKNITPQDSTQLNIDQHHHTVCQNRHSTFVYALPTANTANDDSNNKPSSDFVQQCARQQSVRCSNPPDPSDTGSQKIGRRILSPHITNSNKEDSTLHLVSAKSKNRELNENIAPQDNTQLNIDQHHHAVRQNEHSISYKNDSGAIAQYSVSFPQYGPSTGNIDPKPIIGEHESDSSQVFLPVTKETNLHALQSGISQFWQTLTNQRSLT